MTQRRTLTESAAGLEEQARALAQAVERIDVPADCYEVLGDVRSTSDHLARLCAQLSDWHSKAERGSHYFGEDETIDGASGVRVATLELERALSAFAEASAALDNAQLANGLVHWSSASTLAADMRSGPPSGRALGA